MFRKENGVTLVALVITIIVLLILAGVTVSMVLGDDGILSQAEEAGESQDLGLIRDIATSAMAAAYIDVKTDTPKPTIGAALKAQLEGMEATYGITVAESVTEPASGTDGNIKVTYKTVEYTVSFNAGSITGVTK